MISAFNEMTSSITLPITSVPIIELTVVYDPLILHYGSEAKYERFVNSYFSSISVNGFVAKHNIISVKYNPDSLYINVDGMAGKCWLVAIIDEFNHKKTYYIRNWRDIVNHYTTTHGMEFFEIKQYSK